MARRWYLGARACPSLQGYSKWLPRWRKFGSSWVSLMTFIACSMDGRGEITLAWHLDRAPKWTTCGALVPGIRALCLVPAALVCRSREVGRADVVLVESELARAIQCSYNDCMIRDLEIKVGLTPVSRDHFFAQLLTRTRPPWPPPRRARRPSGARNVHRTRCPGSGTPGSDRCPGSGTASRLSLIHI